MVPVEFGESKPSINEATPESDKLTLEQGQANAIKGRPAEDSQPQRPDNVIDRELEMLALSSSITELDFAFESLSTLLFEIQELRHASAGKSENVDESKKTRDIDEALSKLEDQLQTCSHDVDELEARFRNLDKSQPIDSLENKWKASVTGWRRLQQEAEDVREDLAEDQYLTVYRTVSKQAEEMMSSLEKVFSQCSGFAHDIYSSYAARDSTFQANEAELQKQLNTFISLHKSLHQKTKYYIPSCEKVLRVIEDGISQQKRSLNGEILLSHREMKDRWRNLQERRKRTEREMQGVQDLLSDLSAKTSHSGSAKEGETVPPSSSASNGSRRSSSSTPSRTSAATARNKVGEWLSPSPDRRTESTQLSTTSPTQSRPITPFRRLANRLQRSKSSNEPPLPISSSSPATSTASLSPERSFILPSQPTRSVASNVQSSAHHIPSMARTPSAPATTLSSRRQSQMFPSAAVRDGDPADGGKQTSSRPGSSLASTTDSRPPWNGSSKPVLGASQSASAVNKGRKSLPYSTPQRPPPSSHRYSQIASSYGSSRPPSRIVTSPTFQSRPISPTLSVVSNSSSASAIRARPSSPHSRIPAPVSSESPSRASNTLTRPKLSPSGKSDGEALETLFFDTAGDESHSSLMQRALSPTPSQAASNSTTSGARRKSHIPRPGSRLSLAASTTSQRPSSIYGSYDYRSEMMTPEPVLAATAQDVRNRLARSRVSLGGTSSHLSVMPFHTPGQRRLSASLSATGSRPSSRLSVGGTGTRRSSFYAPSASSSLGTPLPRTLDGLEQPYYPTMYDPLDVGIADIVNSQPSHIFCQREDPPLSKAAAASQAPSERMARYWIGNADKPLHCRLIERKPRSKVMCKLGGEWKDLSIYLIEQQDLRDQYVSQ